MDIDKASISMELDLELSHRGADLLIRRMHFYFGCKRWCCSDTLHVFDRLRNAESSGTFDAKICQDFRDWFSKVQYNFRYRYDSGYDDFKTLIKSSADFMLLCFYLYRRCEDDHYAEMLDALISVRSFENVVLKMNKRAAMAESVVFNDLIDLTGGRDDIPVPVVSSGVLSKVIDFCERKRDFRKIFESLVGRYKDWVTGFVKTNHTILSDLHQAADFLNIPGLLDLTSNALGDMAGKTVEEIPGWYGKLSLSRLLSSLGIEDDGARHHGGTPWAL